MTDPASTNKAGAALIVAIDFGTTFSGVCFAFSDNVQKQILVRSWPHWKGGDHVSDKVPTRISYTDDGKVSGWGFQIKDTDPRYQEFKLGLDKSRKSYSSKISQRFPDTASEKPTDKYTPRRLTTDFLKQLLKCVSENVDGYLGKGAYESLRKEHVITIPAIWPENAKNLTKSCAHDAGMSNVQLITEPEAAMVHALQSSFIDELVPGDSYMLCDAGGGTVDLITYRVSCTEPLQVEEVVEGDGDWCGSVFITRQFREYITKNYDKLHTWTTENTYSAVEGFENNSKRRFTEDNGDVMIKISGVEDGTKGVARVHKSKIFVPSAEVKIMFDKICPDVVKLVKKQLDLAQRAGADVRVVVLVGGFGDSPYLRCKLRQALAETEKDIRLLCPNDGWSAVVRGALSRALPILKTERAFAKVTSRYARRHYGITHSCFFTPDMGPGVKKFWVESEKAFYVEKIYWFLAKGKPIEEGHETRHNYEHSWKSTTTDPKLTSIILNIVTWNNEGSSAPTYADSPGIQKATTLNADLSVVPKEDLIGKYVGDTMYFVCYPTVRITYHFASIQYSLFVGEKCLGEVRAGFEE